MENSVFTLQNEFITHWDDIYKIYEDKPKNIRLSFFRNMNQELSYFYYKYIDHNIWQFQRAYYFAFWIGTLYIKNTDCITQIQSILNFCNIYYPFDKIVGMLNNKVRRVILASEENESKIIFSIMNNFKEKYLILEMQINKIARFFKNYKKRQNLKKCITTILILRKKLPDDIVLGINNRIL